MRKFGPKKADHPSIGELCSACKKPFVTGDYTTLVVLGPGDDPEEQAKRDAGRVYNGIAAEIHWACSTQEGAVSREQQLAHLNEPANLAKFHECYGRSVEDYFADYGDKYEGPDTLYRCICSDLQIEPRGGA